MSQGKHAGSRSCESQEKDSPGEPPEGSSPADNFCLAQ